MTVWIYDVKARKISAGELNGGTHATHYEAIEPRY
jgi:hypothetical protein